MEEALTWLKRCSNPVPGPSEPEIRSLLVMVGITRYSCTFGFSQTLVSFDR